MKTAVVGASGYAGGELLRLLHIHPTFIPSHITAHTNAGELINSLHPHLRGYENRTFSPLDISELRTAELVFLALPHGESAKVIAQLRDDQLIVDLGADYRLQSSQSWKKYYDGDHAGTWTYGLPELPSAREEILKSKRIANPGCYATAIALGTAPALSVIDHSDVVVVAASGTTGAGRSSKASLSASEVMGSLTSYKFGGVHQHTPEIEESLSRVVNKSVNVSFTPILAPMPRGILATITAKLSSTIDPIDEEQLRSLYSNQYDSEEFITFLPFGVLPKTASVTGSNRVHIQVAIDVHTNRVVISVALDNLGKGAAGQAIQNANLIAGFPETVGLVADGLGV
ncbi:MAG: N-acetyl-gamma-glutamyl-phosphate reductase [Candidatus Nanopelagicaceae bacterium]|nr:N-acetyl-gamma-glutamyl-phosphate reductase [Candidatus Nanopelagicaceae bacterium]